MASNAANYAGDVTPGAAWETLAADQDSQLIDVRTRAEWSYVGLPDLSGIDKQALLIEWQAYPSMEINGAFVEALSAELDRLGVRADAPLYFLCRSGARSASAAAAMTRGGRDNCFNVAGGFEGDLDADRHRGRVNGWKAEKLPWMQA